ncbi:hypothetical protein LINGRAHAP2_LOCUS35365 [Linum grandiflorum]
MKPAGGSCLGGLDFGVSKRSRVELCDTGSFVKNSFANLWHCLSRIVEMRAIVDGLGLIWMIGIRKVRVETDSKDQHYSAV